MKLKFKDDFWFGAATSGPQSEGTLDKPNQNIYDHWFQEQPTDFWGGIGPQITCNTYQDFIDDVDYLQKIGLNSFRTSVQWSRLFDDVEKMNVNEKNLKFYRDYFALLKEKQINFVLNLFHFDLPQKLQEKKGFLNPLIPKLYAKYADKCFELFGDLVDNFATFNEPVAQAESQYLYGLHVPFKKDFGAYLQVANNILVAHSLAVKAFKKRFKNNNQKRIAIILNLTPSYPRSESFEDKNAANLRDLLFNKLFLNVASFGEYPKELLDFFEANNCYLKQEPHDNEILKFGVVDFLGVNYYQPARIMASTNHRTKHPWNWFEHYEWPERRINPHRGWEIYPQALYDIGMMLKKDYNNIAWYLSENGMGVEGEDQFKDELGVIQDDYRIEFYKEHLYWLWKAIEDGTNCFGFHAWTFIDCWSWANSFKNRYGFISLDIATQQKTIKKSGHWIKRVVESKEVEILQEYK